MRALSYHVKSYFEPASSDNFVQIFLLLFRVMHFHLFAIFVIHDHAQLLYPPVNPPMDLGRFSDDDKLGIQTGHAL